MASGVAGCLIKRPETFLKSWLLMNKFRTSINYDTTSTLVAVGGMCHPKSKTSFKMV